MKFKNILKAQNLIYVVHEIFLILFFFLLYQKNIILIKIKSMDNQNQEESSEIKLIKAKIKKFDDHEDPLWIFTGKSFYKNQNPDISTNEITTNNSISNINSNLLKKYSIEKKQILEINNTDEINTHKIDFPYSAVGIILIRYTDGSFDYGCGTLIMPGVVITCANLLISDGKSNRSI